MVDRWGRYGDITTSQLVELYNKKGIKFSAVYGIQNKVNNYTYIGSTTNLIGRWSHHYTELVGNKHENTNLQTEWNIFGRDSFEWILLDADLFHNGNLHEREQYFVDYYTEKSIPLFNQRVNDVSINRGVKFTSIARENMSKAQYGKKLSEETKNKISNSNKGRKISQETREKLRFSHQGSKSANAILNEDNVFQIKRRIFENVDSLKDIAKDYFISDSLIGDIKSGNCWSHVVFDEEIHSIKTSSYVGVKNGSAKLTEDNVRAIKQRIINGESNNSISFDYNVSRTSIAHIRNGKLWKHIS